MGRKILLIFILLTAGLFRLKAQDIPVTVLDGPILKVDTLSKNLQLDFPLITDPALPPIKLPDYLSIPTDYETKEERAARINAQTATSVKDHVNENLKWFKPPKLTAAQREQMVREYKKGGEEWLKSVSNGLVYVPDHVEKVFFTGEKIVYRKASSFYRSPSVGFRCCAYPEADSG